MVPEAVEAKEIPTDADGPPPSYDHEQEMIHAYEEIIDQYIEEGQHAEIPVFQKQGDKFVVIAGCSLPGELSPVRTTDPTQATVEAKVDVDDPASSLTGTDCSKATHFLSYGMRSAMSVEQAKPHSMFTISDEKARQYTKVAFMAVEGSEQTMASLDFTPLNLFAPAFGTTEADLIVDHRRSEWSQRQGRGSSSNREDLSSPAQYCNRDKILQGLRQRMNDMEYCSTRLTPPFLNVDCRMKKRGKCTPHYVATLWVEPVPNTTEDFGLYSQARVILQCGDDSFAPSDQEQAAGRSMNPVLTKWLRACE